ncbi:ABC transporter substrate-binding protein [Halomonas denitrificans]|uniref:ABC transporter substrate-binding protein n=1 Tax=Halomonas TaxID=2745 RepID=UPI001A8C0AF8|nr:MULTISPECIES: ABC transporter substrate-binding protein [Halomonas]MED5296535.1 ABC transporter substrate-binding protein [Pseudomonadota bacterium]MBN8413801.1 ABC transporter substrate-binding protein [Halomonas litopenaei]MBY5926642.1 ABC transporter substrate-binding protein [Halomonas sp. DP4Y7-2]MBY5928581.1 ABC transporter substrate-binding protein [Halomonas sp. DP8Y7-3]MBY5983253.1 ABC transporter substrate-binding protein [Halomonas sp. DP5Y7-2]
MPYYTMSAAVLAALMAATPLAAQAEAERSTQEDAQVRFSVPAWPGVTVKTALASTLLETLGYQPVQEELGSTITYQALRQGELDAFLAAWLPAQQGMYDASFEGDEPTLEDLGNNVDGARLGFAVPAYVYDAGLTSAEDLDKEEFAERLDRTIYSIEVGSGMSDSLNAAVDDDSYGLGDWELSETSTPGMLSAVDAAIDREEWIVFAGWTPHWMNIEFDVRYLDDPNDMWGPEGGRSDVRTLVRREFAQSHPNATRLLDQLVFSADDQSAMIRGFSYEEREPEQVALEWLQQHPEQTRSFVEGVTTRDGEEAWPVIQQALEIPDA